MTVAGDIEMGKYLCQWFAGKKLEQGWFRPETLIKVRPEEADDGNQGRGS